MLPNHLSHSGATIFLPKSHQIKKLCRSVKLQSKKLKERDHLRDLGVDGNIIGS
jgi:hypothetical protein